MVELLFWITLGVLGCICVGYPVVLFFLASRIPAPQYESGPALSVSIIIAARNEADNIARKLASLVSQDYPAELLEIIIVSDGSEDATAEKVVGHLSSRVKLIELSEHMGKAIALNVGAEAATGNVLVFSDVRQFLQTDAIRRLLCPFSDPEVGAVGGLLAFKSDDSSQGGTRNYWSVESKIRIWESRIGSAVGLSGALYAIRKELFTPLPEGLILDDVLVPMRGVRRGYRAIINEEVQMVDVLAKSTRQELDRKVRTLAGNYQLIVSSPWLVSPLDNPVWAQFVVHKVARLMIPLLLLATLALALLSTHSFYHWFFFFALSACLIGLAALSPYSPDWFQKRFSLFREFMLLTIAASIAPVALMKASHKKLWIK